MDHKINLLIKTVTNAIETFEYPKAIISIIDIFDSAQEGISKKNYETILKLISPFCPHITEEIWEKIGNKGFICLEKWPKADETKINPRFDQEEQIIEKVASDINNILRIVQEKQGIKKTKAYIYVLPNELNLYKDSIDFIKKKTNLEIVVFAVNDKGKYDPENKSGKTKPGKPAIHLE